MTSTNRLIIRDGVANDIPICLQLDHTYQTEFVWQLNIHGDAAHRDITLRQERLPRTMDVDYPKSEHRLKTALPQEHAFIVAAESQNNLPIAYIILTHNPVMRSGHIRDIVVDEPFRRTGIGTRLLRVAHRWARQHPIERVFAETHTINHPAISFYQHRGYTFCGFNDQYFDNQDIAIFFSLALH